MTPTLIHEPEPVQPKTIAPIVAAVDFETFFGETYSVKTLGPVAYSLHPRFDAYLVSIVADNGLEYVGAPKDAPWNEIAGAVWVSHNAGFDSACWMRLRRDNRVPEAGPCEWHCTADLCAYLQLPRALADVVDLLYGVKLNKAVRERQQGRHYQDELLPETELNDYALADSKWCLRLWIDHGHKWPDNERELSHLTRMWGYAGVSVDLPRLSAGISTLSQIKFDAVKSLPWAAECDDATVLSVKHLAAECRKAGIEPPASLAMNDEDCEAWETLYGGQFPWVAAMRTWRRSNMLLSKLEAIRARVTDAGVMPINLKYCGAQHTGRWSGDAGVNMQNLPRGEMMGVDLRQCFVPAKGCKFVVADFSQIEPRVLAWLADDTEMLERVRAGVPLYEAHARATMGYTDPRPLKEVDPRMYSLAKARVLGMGYGCGPRKFAQVAVLFGFSDYKESDAKRDVDAFRRSNKPTVAMWDYWDRQLRVSATSENREMRVPLPSGRVIRYFDVKSERGVMARVVQGSPHRYLYGSMVVENIVQATAREVFAAALLRVNQIPGVRIVWHIHDEIVAEVSAINAERLQGEIERAMCVPPEWAKDLPVAVESSIEEAYTK